MKKEYPDLDPLHLDVLREISNIGAGNAATALSDLIHRRINMSIPTVRLLDFEEVPGLVGGADALVAGVFLEVGGDWQADLVLFLPWSQAVGLLVLMLGQREQQSILLTEMEQSALEELGNILANSFLTALAHFTNLRLYASVPALAVDMAGAVLSLPLARLGEIGDQALVIDTMFLEEHQKIQGYFLFIPRPDHLQGVFTALGVNGG